jgi:hypothetical protein
MRESFLRLKKHKRAYLVCSVGQKYIDMVEELIHQIHKYSQFPVFLYYSNGNVNFDSPSLIKQRFEIDSSAKFEIEGINPDSVRALMLTTVKPKACRLHIEEFVFLDSDILVTPVIDSVFIKHGHKISNYPIFLRYSWDWVTTNGKPHVADILLDRIGIKREPTITSLCTCLFIANRNCKSFISDWEKYCTDSEIMKFALSPQGYGGFTDESVANALAWLYKCDKSIPTDLLWAWKYEPVKYVFDFYDGLLTGELPKHSSQMTHYKLEGENEVPFGLSVIPESKQNFLGTHFLKDVELIKKVSTEIGNRF